MSIFLIAGGFLAKNQNKVYKSRYNRGPIKKYESLPKNLPFLGVAAQVRKTVKQNSDVKAFLSSWGFNGRNSPLNIEKKSRFSSTKLQACLFY